MNRRAFVVACCAAVPMAAVLSVGDGGIRAQRAEAGVAVLVSLEELVTTSTSIVVGTAADRRSVWEDLPSGRRIVTYTRLTVEETIKGADKSELWVRTLGGVVGDLGQAVSGEASFRAGSRSLVFALEVNGVAVVNAMAQGHYPVVRDATGVDRLASSPDAGMLVPRRGPTISAHERLVGAPLEDAITAIQKAAAAGGPR
jgi:hypothetical protein